MDVPNFHCLFSFFEEDSFAVGDLKWVNLSGCGVSRDKLNPKHWKKDTVITVRWPDKKGQYQLYPAKILKMSADKHSLIKLRDQLIKGYESEEDCGRGKRKRKALCISSDDEEPAEKDIIKKKPEKRPSLLSKLLEKRKEQLIGSTAVQECTNCCALKEKIKQLEEDNRRVVLHLDTINELKSMVCALKGDLEERSAPSKHQKPAIFAHPHSSQDNQVEPLEDDVTIADGVTVNKIQLMRCNHQRPSKLVCDLLGVMFTMEELSTHSLTGLKGGASESVKPSLNKKHVNAIFDLTKFWMRSKGRMLDTISDFSINLF
ncbi:BEN domain-containing protein 6-like [Carassius gibelio]|uniref:BEN domain-containing protein 6-like n=1 Tax=Carassius gibelio TaxID=101364 RepID=UPI0022788846|nr:BEN domain-containing protein 6-like [Carassius gibelio]